MANIKSAIKRIDTIKRQKNENRLVKSTLSTSIKKFKKLLSEDLVKAEAQLKETISLIDKAETKGILHKNNASKKVSRLTSALYKAQNAKTQETKVEEVEEVKVETKAEEVKAEEPKKEVKKTRKSTKKDA